jgi:hypothetical protein
MLRRKLKKDRKRPYQYGEGHRKENRVTENRRHR